MDNFRSVSALLSEEEMMDFVLKVEKNTDKLDKYLKKISGYPRRELTIQEKHCLEMAYNKEVLNFVRNDFNAKVMDGISKIQYAHVVEDRWLMIPLKSWCPACQKGMHTWFWCYYIRHDRQLRARVDLSCVLMHVIKKDVL